MKLAGNDSALRSGFFAQCQSSLSGGPTDGQKKPAPLSASIYIIATLNLNFKFQMEPNLGELQCEAIEFSLLHKVGLFCIYVVHSKTSFLAYVPSEKALIAWNFYGHTLVLY